MKTYSKNCIICNKEVTGVRKRKLCGNRECKKQNSTNISKRIQQNRTLEEKKKHAIICKKWRKKTGYKNKRKYGKGTGVKYQIMRNLNGRYHQALKAQDAKKCGKALELLGCSIEYFMDYLESALKQGMVWMNYGQYGWHLDHIKPCIAFDLSDPKQQEECFHYTNLQPLWWWENISKNEMISHLKKSIEFKNIFTKPNLLKD